MLSKNYISIETPGYDEIFDLYVAYGIIESLVRSGCKELALIPIGKKYIIKFINGELETGMINALTDMLSLHYAISVNGESYIDFSRGANINNVYYKSKTAVYKRLEMTRQYLIENNGKELYKDSKVTIPLPLMPNAGKYMTTPYKVPNSPTKTSYFYFALGWIGFHYYTPYINLSDRNNETYIHIFCVKPLEPLSLLEVLSIKDLKSFVNRQNKRTSFVNKKIALLYYLSHLESLGAIETIINKHFSVINYTLENINNKQAIRSFSKYELSKLMDFLWNLKKDAPLQAIKFLDRIIIGKKTDKNIELGNALDFIDGILYDNLESIYNCIRSIKEKIPLKIINSILEWFNKKLD